METIKSGSQKQRLFQELTAYERAGVKLMLDGKDSYPNEIAKACKIKEKSSYMRDIISDDDEMIREIHFTKIKDEKKKKY